MSEFRLGIAAKNGAIDSLGEPLLLLGVSAKHLNALAKHGDM